MLLLFFFKLNRIILMLKSILLIVLTYIMVDPVLLSQYSRNVKCIVICYILECLRTLFYYHIRFAIFTYYS